MERASARLDERLSTTSSRPFALALSGGGDSTALALIAAAWARRVGRKLLILNVDHRLQPASADWTRACAAFAQRLGADFEALVWDGPKPQTGLPAAARTARHRLLADAARAAGARILLLGHTADDVLEAQLMRAAGSTTPDPRPWSPSPAWPEGRGLHILRPLLDAGREAVRDFLRGEGEAWIDDPANLDLSYARPRARAAPAVHVVGATPVTPETPPAFAVDRAGVVILARAQIDAAFLARAVVCAGGGARLPSRARLSALAARLAGDDAVTATLAGASVVAAGESVQILREPGESARGGLAPVRIEARAVAVWDGRFEIHAGAEAVEVRGLGGASTALTRAERETLRAWSPRARRGLPLISVDNAAGSLLAPPPGVTVRELVGERLSAACGLVEREAD